MFGNIEILYITNIESFKVLGDSVEQMNKKAISGA